MISFFLLLKKEMLLKTHIAITLCFVLIFLNYFLNPLVFLLGSLIGTVLPDIDTRFSSVGKKKKYRALQYFLEHRGFLHSFVFLFLVFIILFYFFREFSLGFLLGFGLHLFADSLTKKGTFPFYPFKFRIRGVLKTGGIFEWIFFVFLLFVNLFLLISALLKYI